MPVLSLFGSHSRATAATVVRREVAVAALLVVLAAAFLFVDRAPMPIDEARFAGGAAADAINAN